MGTAEGNILLDTKDWPIVHVTYQGRVSDEVYANFIAEVEKLRRRREPYVAIYHNHSVIDITPSQRKMHADSLERDRELLETYMKAAAFVQASRLTRGLITAIFWLSRPPYPYRFCADPEEAETWVRGFLD